MYAYGYINYSYIFRYIYGLMIAASCSGNMKLFWICYNKNCVLIDYVLTV